jgi:hypothetical protein
VEARLLCGLVGELEFTMSSGEVDIESRPRFLRYCSRLPHTTGIWKQSCIEYESVCNVNDHSGTVRLPVYNRKSSGVLDLLEKRLDQ